MRRIGFHIALMAGAALMLAGCGFGDVRSPLPEFMRARKALQMLNIRTLGELASRTEAELMGVKNFGATSLAEIKQRLQDHGLSLRRLEF